MSRLCYFEHLVKCHGLFDNPASLKSRPSQRVAIRSSCPWRRSSFLTNLACKQLSSYLLKMFNLGSGVWIPYQERHISILPRISNIL